MEIKLYYDKHGYLLESGNPVKYKSESHYVFQTDGERAWIVETDDVTAERFPFKSKDVELIQPKKTHKVGTVKMTYHTNGFPKGLILKRKLTLRECRYILSELLGIDIGTREDYEFSYEYKEYNDELCHDVNAWLMGDSNDEAIAQYAYDCSDEQLGLMNLIPIIAYLKKKHVI